MDLRFANVETHAVLEEIDRYENTEAVQRSLDNLDSRKKNIRQLLLPTSSARKKSARRKEVHWKIISARSMNTHELWKEEDQLAEMLDEVTTNFGQIPVPTRVVDASASTQVTDDQQADRRNAKRANKACDSRSGRKVWLVRGRLRTFVFGHSLEVL